MASVFASTVEASDTIQPAVLGAPHCTSVRPEPFPPSVPVQSTSIAILIYAYCGLLFGDNVTGRQICTEPTTKATTNALSPSTSGVSRNRLSFYQRNRQPSLAQQKERLGGLGGRESAVGGEVAVVTVFACEPVHP